MSTSSQTVDFGQALKGSFDKDANALQVIDVSQLIPKQYDTIQLSYTGSNLTEVVYKLGGLTVATLDLTYSGSNLVQIVKS